MRGIVFDIETCSAAELHQRPDFIRLCGWMPVDHTGVQLGPTVISTDPEELIETLDQAEFNSGHWILNFDLLALAKWHRDAAWYEKIAAKAWDTFIVERHLDPVAAQGMQRNGYYGLDATAQRYGVAGKSDDIRALAKRHGGFDKIPRDDDEYQDYLQGDVAASRGLLQAQQRAVAALPQADQQYIRREHRVQASLTSSITLGGFRVDMDLTMKRYTEGQQRLQDGREKMHREYGMPLEGKAPHRTTLGKAAFKRAILATGISEAALDANWPVGKDGSLLTSKDTLTPLVDVFSGPNPEAADLCRTILAMNGERTVAGTMLDHVVTDEHGTPRVHPTVSADQGSGRWSIKDPGLSVLGKRGGKHVERAMVTADEGELLVAIDADQVDGRVVAAECQDPAYMDLFTPGRDIHSEVAALVYGCELVDGRVKPEDKHLREEVKAYTHGFSYGLGAKGMSAQRGVPVEACQRFIDGFVAAFPRLDAWKEEVRQAAGALGYDEPAPEGDTYRILRTWAGRPVRVERTRAYTQATAMIGQGGTRDVMAHALLSLPPYLRSRVKAVIHDEFVFSLPADRADELAGEAAEAMSFDLKGVRITFGVSKASFDWSGCY